MLQTETFIRTVICGFIATFVMTIISFLQGGLGLPVIDVGHILKQSFNHVHGTEVYSIFWGNMAYNVIGVLLALFWVVFLQKRIPGNWFIQGLIYGIIISIVAGLIVSPLAALSTGDSIGFFYTDTWIPGRILLAGLVMHLGYGWFLTLGLKIAGVGNDQQLS
ncbi:MAG: hypothetical protein WDZ38_02475 [Balneolaceae bacterium]